MARRDVLQRVGGRARRVLFPNCMFVSDAATGWIIRKPRAGIFQPPSRRAVLRTIARQRSIWARPGSCAGIARDRRRDAAHADGAELTAGGWWRQATAADLRRFLGQQMETHRAQADHLSRSRSRLSEWIPTQEIVFKLKQYWSDRGCIIQEPFDVEVGAGTSCPETFLRVLGPKPYRIAYVQPSRRPADGRYGDNPNRLYKHMQLQVLLKPTPADVIEQYMGSLEAIGIDLRKHDLKLEEDNWENPSLGAWGVGWQVMLDGLEITQFTYFQQCGGIDLELVPAEITYGLERLTAFLQVMDSVYDIEWTRGEVPRRAFRRRAAVFGLQLRDGECGDAVEAVRAARGRGGEVAGRVSEAFGTPRSNWAVPEPHPEKQRFPLLPTYEHVLKCSHLFNTLDARGAISVTERVAVIATRAEDCGGSGGGVDGPAERRAAAISTRD